MLTPDTKIAVTGGAGYIGSATVKYLQDKGYKNLVILDNFSAGHKETTFTRAIEVDLINKEKLLQIFQKEKFEAVIHFAALLVVFQSMEDPYRYFHHNFNTSINLLDSMQQTGVKNIVFSSTCAVYGNPNKLPISEEESVKPENVYAETKNMIEKVIQWYGKIFNLQYAILRYFNACGAASDGSYGEAHDPETHLIPSAIKKILNSKPVEVYGNDYETPDGTCIRDYIHIADLANAHELALRYIMNENKSDTFNLGIGKGHSTLEVVKIILEEAKEHHLEGTYEIKPRRPGDGAILYADNSKAKKLLNWNPTHTQINEIIAEAFRWHMKQKGMSPLSL